MDAGQPVTIVEREDVAVMCKRVPDAQEAIRRGWVELEQAVGSLRGRNFSGAFDPASGDYRACVQLREGDEPDALGLEPWTLPGGRYLRARLHGEPPAVYELIAPTFERLATGADVDTSRPSIELYRRRDVIDLLLPVA